jgi:desulfoferrodoxin (superoxide reductase-like protein)
MEKVGDLFQSSDWKKEKHLPVIIDKLNRFL